MNNTLKIEVPNRFQRSIRIDSDFDDINILDSFINSNTANRALEDLCHHISSAGQCSFTWTGPYGSGKSSLAVMFNAALSHGTTKNKKIAKKLLDNSTIEAIDKTFKKYSERIVLPIVAGRKDIEEQICEELAPFTKIKSSNAIELLNDICQNKQLIIIIDELGKALDYAAQKKDGIFILQEIAELANRSKGSLLFIGILHQSFSEYANNLNLNTKKEWAKIQGRYLDISINSSIEEQIKLLSSAIIHNNNNWSNTDPQKSVINFIKQFSDSHSWASEKIFINLWPLNPVFALALGPMTKKSFSQNQRSLFSFLNSSEPYGFKSFVEKWDGDIEKFYGLQDFWHYLDINYSNLINNSKDGHKWILANDCVDKARLLDLPLVENIVVIISLIQIFGLKNYLYSNKETIYACFPFDKIKEIDNALEILIKKKIIVLRKLDDIYLLTEGSDFDLENELGKFLDRYRTLTSENISSIKQFKAILAKRHYIKTGYIRKLNYSISPVSHLQNNTDEIIDKNKNSIILTIATENENDKLAKNLINKFINDINVPCVVGYVDSSSALANSVRQFLALENLRVEHSSMLSDRVARKEVDTMLRITSINLEEEFDKLSQSATWYFAQYNKKQSTPWESTSINNLAARLTKLNEKISDLFDDFYHNAPVIKNELLNRDKLNPNGSGALKKFLLALIESPHKKNLGIEGHPPELSIMKSVIEAHSLQEVEKLANYKLVLPKKSNAKKMYDLFEKTKKLLLNKEKVKAEEITIMWSAPPFGIKKGLHNLLLFLFILTNRKNVALYYEDLYQVEYNDLTIDYLFRGLKDFTITWISYDDVKDKIGYLAKACAKETDQLIEDNPLNIGRALKKFLNSKEDWVKVTNTLSKNTLLFRDELKKAKDPVDFVINQIPIIFNKSNKTDINKMTKEDIEDLKNSIKEIKKAFDRQLEKFKASIFENFKITEDKNSLDEINERASLIINKTGDFELNSICLRLSRLDNSKETLLSLMSVFAKKDIQKIYDYDVERILIDIAAKAQSFKKAEAFIKVDNRERNMTAFSIVHGDKKEGSEKPTTYDFMLSKKEEKKADELAIELERIIKRKELELFENNNVTLGAIAKLISNRRNESNE